MNLVIIDIQPLYSDYCRHLFSRLSETLNKLKESLRVTWYFNGEEIGCDDTPFCIQEMLWENVDFEEFDINFIEKGYGFFRDHMDAGVEGAEILENLENGEYENEHGQIHIPDIELPNFEQKELFRLCGGGRNECLAEMELYFQHKGYNNYRMLENLVY